MLQFITFIKRQKVFHFHFNYLKMNPISCYKFKVKITKKPTEEELNKEDENTENFNSTHLLTDYMSPALSLYPISSSFYYFCCGRCCILLLLANLREVLSPRDVLLIKIFHLDVAAYHIPTHVPGAGCCWCSLYTKLGNQHVHPLSAYVHARDLDG